MDFIINIFIFIFFKLGAFILALFIFCYFEKRKEDKSKDK